jgi:hypothetical protein
LGVVGKLVVEGAGADGVYLVSEVLPAEEGRTWDVEGEVEGYDSAGLYAVVGGLADSFGGEEI